MLKIQTAIADYSLQETGLSKFFSSNVAFISLEVTLILQFLWSIGLLSLNSVDFHYVFFRNTFDAYKTNRWKATGGQSDVG